MTASSEGSAPDGCTQGVPPEADLEHSPGRTLWGLATNEPSLEPAPVSIGCVAICEPVGHSLWTPHCLQSRRLLSK